MATFRRGSDPRLGPGAEFDLIRTLAGGATLPAEITVGPGDDAAVLEDGWVVTCDLSVEDVHFRRGWMTPAEIGGRAARAALSDLAAMAARPVAALVSLAGTRADHADGTLRAVGEGARRAVEALGAVVAGGDLTRSPGPLIVDVMVWGRARTPILRGGARPGDHLWVTGPLGGAGAAIRLLEQGATSLAPGLRAALVTPPPRVTDALALAGTGLVTALIDLSDGIAGDAAHLAAASGVRVVLDPVSLPLHPDAVAALGEDDARAAALHAGEDYELLFAADPDFDGRLSDLAAALACAPVRVGRIEAGEGVVCPGPDGALVPVGRAWDHFGGAGE